MAEIVNLRRERKKKALAEKGQIAEQNRAIHGRSKAERLHMQKLAAQSAKFLDGHRRNGPDSGSEQ